MLFNYDEQHPRLMGLVLDNGIALTGEFIDLRIEVKSLPQGKEWYHIRHADEDWGEPASFKNGCVAVNFYGTFICDPIPCLKQGDEVNIIQWHWLDE